MRRFSVLLLAALSACASAPAGPVSPGNAVVAAPAPTGNVTADLLARAGSTNAPTREAVERALGAADIARQDGAGAALTYRLDSCALLLLFAADGRSTMRLQEAHISARQPGLPAPSLAQCAGEADARRS